MRNEEELEDYICEHLADFKNELQKALDHKSAQIEFVGRQVEFGVENRVDLLFTANYAQKMPDGTVKNRLVPIIVELKNRNLEPRDVAQLSRYLSVAEDWFNFNADKTDTSIGIVQGVLVGPGVSEDFTHLWINERGFAEIYLLKFSPKVIFSQENLDYRWKEEYINNLEIDDRVKHMLEFNKNARTK